MLCYATKMMATWPNTLIAIPAYKPRLELDPRSMLHTVHELDPDPRPSQSIPGTPSPPILDVASSQPPPSPQVADLELEAAELRGALNTARAQCCDAQQATDATEEALRAAEEHLAQASARARKVEADAFEAAARADAAEALSLSPTRTLITIRTLTLD